jgi:hypothetical protein
MRRQMLGLLLMVALVPLAAQECPPSETLSEKEIRHLVFDKSRTGWDDKLIYRLGDAAAVSILKWIPDQELDSTLVLPSVLRVLRESVEGAAGVGCSDGLPLRFTQLLLDRIRSFKAAAKSQRDIDALQQYISRLTVAWKPASGKSDTEFNRKIAEVIQAVSSIKPGMKRAALMPYFTTEGGFYVPRERVYVVKLCRFIKVDVEFAVIENASPDNPEDVITKISRPYLQFSVMD